MESGRASVDLLPNFDVDKLFGRSGIVEHFNLQGVFAARVDLQGTGLHALFTGEDDTWEARLVYDSAGFPLNVGQGNGIKLRRGFSSSGSSKPTQVEEIPILEMPETF